MIAEHHPHSDAKVLHNWILEQNYDLLLTQYLKSGKSEEPSTHTEETGLTTKLAPL